jgi:polar amino acid transport system substrate-binding protein
VNARENTKRRCPRGCPALSGAMFRASVASTRPTVGALFQFITQNMPLGNPESLSHDQYVSIMAFVLSKNGFKAGGAPLTFEGASKSDAKIVKGQ